jgi:ribosome-associated protein
MKQESIVFSLREGDEFIPLIHLLKVTQVANSGGESQGLVLEGMVTLNGQLETRKRAKIRSGDVVGVNGITITVA